MNECIIRTTDICKKYGDQQLFKHLDLNINSGQCTVITGKNGSGKTTLLKLLMGMVKADVGNIEYLRNLRMAYIPERLPQTSITALSFAISMAMLEGMSKRDAERTAKKLYSDFYMENMLQTPMKYLSKGSLQKVAVIQALLCYHDVLFLDEPLSGQDVASKAVFISKTEECKAKGTAIVLSCHESDLADRIGDEIFEIAEERLISVLSLERKMINCVRMVFQFADSKREIPKMDFVHKVIIAGHEFTVFSSLEHSNDVAMELMSKGYRLMEMQHEKII